MVTMFSALSSSSDATMRLSRSLCGAAFLAATAGFLAAGFLTEVFLGFAALFTAFGAGFLPDDFWPGAFWAPALGPAAFLAVLRVRAEFLMCQEARFSMASCAAPRAWLRSSVELSWER